MRVEAISYELYGDHILNPVVFMLVAMLPFQT